MLCLSAEPATVETRSGTPEDALCLGVLATQVFLDTYATNGIRSDLAREALSVYSQETFAARLADPNTCFILAEVKGHLVAFAEVALGRACPAPGFAQVEVARLYVQRNFQRLGIGRTLVLGAERLAREHGFESVWLTAWSGNIPALAFYPAMGYRDIGVTTYVIEGQGYENRIFANNILHGASAMTFDGFLKLAWNDHADQPQDVADRLAASLHLVESPEHMARFAGLVTHVFGEHLGQWNRGIVLLRSLQDLPAHHDDAMIADRLNRAIATLRFAGGESRALEFLTPEHRASALATAAAAFAGQKEFKRAIAAYSEATQLADAGLPSGSPAIGALAVGGNNLAAALEGKKDRDGFETEGMVAAAQGGLKYWTQAGTWLEVQRAEYRLARSHLHAGQAGAAVESANRCIDVCALNNAPAFEQFFAHAALALAQRAASNISAFETARDRALGQLEQVPAEERKWCASELKEIAG